MVVAVGVVAVVAVVAALLVVVEVEGGLCLGLCLSELQIALNT